MSVSFWQIAIVAVLVVLLFGRGKISELMGDVAKGINSFRSGLKEADTDISELNDKAISHNDPLDVSTDSEKDKSPSRDRS